MSYGPQPRNDPHVRLIVEWSPTLQISDSAAMALSLDDLPNDVEKLKAMVLAISAETEAALAEQAKLAAEHARLDHERMVLAAEVERTKEQNERLEHIINVLRRAQVGRKSERISVEQMALALEDVETSFSSDDAIAEKKSKIVRREGTNIRRANRGHLPAHLPREEVVIEPEARACPCCGNALHVIGEDVCKRSSVPAQMFAREGVQLNRSTLAHWVGFAAAELEPVHAWLVQILKSSPKLFADETTCPVLDPGRGRTKTGYLWTIARDDRPWGGRDPPAVAYLYSPGRGGKYAVRHLAGYSGILQVDGYVGYDAPIDANRAGGSPTLAYCWSHFRRRFYEIAAKGNAPIATEALERIGALYKIGHQRMLS